MAAAQLARFVRACGAADLLEHRKANEHRERLPIPFAAIGTYRAKLQRAECGRAKGFQRLKNRDEAFGITQYETSIGKAQYCAEEFVRGGHFNLLATREFIWDFFLQQK